MDVFITTDAKKSLKQYKQRLSKPPYSLSNKRIRVKFNNMIDALLSLGKQDVHTKGTICMHKDLGQIFDAQGNALYKNLYRFNYEDESKFQWAFAYNVDKKINRITITKMIPSRNVKEQRKMSYNQKKALYESIMKEVAVIVKREINEIS